MEDRRGVGLNPGLIVLRSGDARADISLLGAEAVSWSVGGRNLLWERQGAHWDRVAPILFPCVGWSRGGRVTIGGRVFPMPVHGFAPNAEFFLVDSEPDRATLELRSSPVTRAHYPFQFRLLVHYRLGPQTLRIELEVRNEDWQVMPYACGLHPGFAWPFAGGAQDDYELRFDREEWVHVPVIAEGGLFSSRKRAIPMESGSLRLHAGLFENEALCFLHANSRGVTFAGPGGAIFAQARGFRHWALWSRPGAPFLCVEAWTGHGDPVGFADEFREKPSIDLLEPGEMRRHALDLRFSSEPRSPCSRGENLRRDRGLD